MSKRQQLLLTHLLILFSASLTPVVRPVATSVAHRHLIELGPAGILGAQQPRGKHKGSRQVM